MCAAMLVYIMLVYILHDNPYGLGSPVRAALRNCHLCVPSRVW